MPGTAVLHCYPVLENALQYCRVSRSLWDFNGKCYAEITSTFHTVGTVQASPLGFNRMDVTCIRVNTLVSSNGILRESSSCVLQVLQAVKRPGLPKFSLHPIMSVMRSTAWGKERPIGEDCRGSESTMNHEESTLVVGMQPSSFPSRYR